MQRFIFDLDGTLTQEETLPLLARYFREESAIERITQKTLIGSVPFVESFIQRVHILGKYPVTAVSEVLSRVPLYEALLHFIQTHKEQCVVATGNLDVWIAPLMRRIGCTYHSSTALVHENTVVKLTSILRKEDIVAQYKKQGDTVIFVGDSNNDAEAMRYSDISIACALTHTPAYSVTHVADYLVYAENTLCRQLYQIAA